MGLEIAVGFLIAWVVGKARRAGQQLDGVVDDVVDAGAVRVRELVLSKLGNDSAVERLQIEAAQAGEISDLTRQRLELALQDAVDRDANFASDLHAALEKVSDAGAAAIQNTISVSGTATASGPGSSAVGSIGSIDGNVSFGGQSPDPR